MNLHLSELTAQCRAGRDLLPAQSREAVEALLDPGFAEEEKADFLRALTDKGETAAELCGFVEALLPHAIDPGLGSSWQGRALFDCCGTGGGALNLVNVSTALMPVMGAAGVPVVKHGNRGVTKQSGSADVLGVLGVPVEMTAEQTRRVFAQTNLAFLYAPQYHPAFARLAAVRRRLAAEGRRSIFNLLGPLLNPARPTTQLVGLFRRENGPIFTEAMSLLGRKRYLAVYGETEEGSPLGEYSIWGGNILLGNVMVEAPDPTPPTHSHKELLVRGAEESAGRILHLLRGEDHGPLRDLVEANAALGLLVQGAAKNYAEGLAQARESIRSGAALRKLTEWRAACQKVVATDQLM